MEKIFITKYFNKWSKEFLNWCKNEKISMAVCTNKTEHLAVDLLKKSGFMIILNM